MAVVDARAVRAAMADVAWAALDSLARSDSARAHGLIAAFQTLWNANRSVVIDGWREGGTDLAAHLPFLAIDGVYGQQTRVAMMAVLPFAEPVLVSRSLLAEMPSTARDVAAWYSRAASSVSRTHRARAFIDAVRARSPSQVFDEALRYVRVASSHSAAPAPAEPTQASSTPGGRTVTVTDPIVITAPRAQTAVWPWLLAGLLGVGVFVAAIAYGRARRVTA